MRSTKHDDMAMGNIISSSRSLSTESSEDRSFYNHLLTLCIERKGYLPSSYAKSNSPN